MACREIGIVSIVISFVFGIFFFFSYLVQHGQCPVGGREGREDGSAQLEGASAYAQGGFQDDDGRLVMTGGQQLLPNDRDDDERRLVQPHGLQLPVGRLQRGPQRRFHGRLHQTGQQLQGLRILGQAGAEGRQSVRMPAETLERHSLSVITLI